MYPCKYRAPSSSSLDSCQKEKQDCVKERGKPCFCRCPRKLDPYQTCKENLRDITDSIAKILIIMGMKPDIVNPSKQLIFALFHHYDYARWSYEAKDPEKVHKDHIKHIFMKVFEFQNIESELAYLVTKRAFKAYFNSKCKGIHNPALDVEMTAQNTSVWRHAARTTSRIIEAHDSLLPRLDKDYNKKVLQVYIDMCCKIRKRVDPFLVPYCTCNKCAAVRLPVNQDYEEVPAPLKQNKKACKCHLCNQYKGPKPLKPGVERERPNKWEIFGVGEKNCQGRPVPPFRTCLTKKTIPPTKSEDSICLYRKDPLPQIPTIPWCTKCKIYKMICDCHDNGNRESQGPFETYWVRVTGQEDDEKIPGDIKQDPENHHCPVDCEDLSLMSDTEPPTDYGPKDEDEEDSSFCCCSGESAEEEEEEVSEGERNANFVQPYCYCQNVEDIGI